MTPTVIKILYYTILDMKYCSLPDAFKRVVLFFFFVKILIIRTACIRMYPLYKNAYKRQFCSNIKELKGYRNE